MKFSHVENIKKNYMVKVACARSNQKQHQNSQFLIIYPSIRSLIESGKPPKKILPYKSPHFPYLFFVSPSSPINIYTLLICNQKTPTLFFFLFSQVPLNFQKSQVSFSPKFSTSLHQKSKLYILFPSLLSSSTTPFR